MTPHCPNCHWVLDRLDHYGIEHLILEDNVYRSVAIVDRMPDGGFGLASETDLRCGYCGASVDREAREFFYRRWCQVLEATKRRC